MNNSDPSFVTQRLSYAVNVRGFAGVDPTGMTDSSEGFKEAIDVCRDRNYSTLHVPAGVYKIQLNATGTGCTDTGICLDDLVGLCIRGDGSDRGGGATEVGTVIQFDFESTSGGIGIGVRGSEAIRFENLTLERIVGTGAIGVQVESATGEARAIQFQNVTFRGWDIAVQTGAGAACSELAFYDCDFTGNRIGFKSNTSSAVNQKFVGCTGGGDGSDGTLDGMETMFDIEDGGGNLSVLGFGGQNIETLVKVGDGNGNIGWNLFHNVRLEQLGDGTSSWGTSHRTKLYEATATTTGTNQRTEFDGVVITPPDEDPEPTGVRISLLKGHTVVLRNASSADGYELATAGAKLLEFSGSEGQRGGTLLCFNVTVPFDARVDRDTVPEDGVYSFRECNKENEPYPDLLNPPLYGPNYLMKVESHCWSLGDGLNGVTVATNNGGTVTSAPPSDAYRAGVFRCTTGLPGDVASLVSATNAVQFGGGAWRFQVSVRIPALSTGFENHRVRLGFGDDGENEPANGLYFFYDVASANWQCVVRKSGTTTTAINSMKVVAVGWHTFEIEVSGAGVSTFFYDGERITTTADTPTAVVGLMPIQVDRTSSGEPTEPDPKYTDIDYFKYTFRPDTVGAMFPE